MTSATTIPFCLCQYHHDFVACHSFDTALYNRVFVDAAAHDRTNDIKMPRPRTSSTASNGSAQARDQVITGPEITQVIRRITC